MRTLNALTLALALLSGFGAESLLGRITGFFSALSAPESVDTGCKLDPSGKCAPAPTADTGCKLDPDGTPVCYPGF
ncbi:MAG TPA: hypothetical protein VH394_29720 [Thermoanaerobaculia bacterium]|jgi:hypothetical protein|nr:hypothetical protein [Thermoanaerobaculia bacterium]